MKKKGAYILSVILLLFVWQITALWIDNEALFPTVPALFNSLIILAASQNFWISLAVTLSRGIVGILLSFSAATLFSLLFARHTFIYELFRPVLSIMRSVPVISFILLALLFINPEVIPLFIGFLTMFPILTENLTQGFLYLNKDILQMGKLFQINRFNYYTQILYSQLKPFLYSGLATAAGFGWRAIIMGEVLAQCSFGIGSEMKRAQLFIAVPELLAWTAVAVLIGFIADKSISKLSVWSPGIRYSLPHKPSKNYQPLTSPIEIKNISFSYDKTAVLENLSLQINPQQITGFSAPSGTGKTTFLYLLSDVLMPSKGTIEKESRISVSFLFQEPRLLAHLSVLENIMLPLATFMPRTEAKEKAFTLLKEMQMEEKAFYHPGRLSYGQQQRVALARALAYPAPLLLMDEPFKGLDQTLIYHLVSYIKTQQARHRQTILFTSHQVSELEQLADHIIKL